MSWKRVIYVLFVVLVAGVSALSGVVAGAWAVYSTLQGKPPAAIATTPSPVVSQIEPDGGQIHVSTTEIETAITTAVEQVGPAVVTILGTIPGGQSLFGRLPDQQVSGSGVIISADGYILTNNHVVENAAQVVVLLADGTELPADVVGTDLFSDLAVLKTQGEMPAIANLGNSDALKPGETVIAIGSPLGDFVNSVTVGVISATGRALDTGNGYRMEDLVQTDAAINQGNSGGPLVNLAGEVIGINTLIVRGSGLGSAVAEGLGFAIPTNTARVVAEQIISQGYVARPYLGVRWQAVTPRLARSYDLPVQWGAFITEVVPGGPAASAGLRKGDIITHIGAVELDEEHSYINALFASAPGDQVKIKIARGMNTLEIEVTLGETRIGG